MHYTYAIVSNIESRIYVGMTQNIIRRVEDHNKGWVRSTKFYRPWKLLYKEKHETRDEARSREKYLKSGIGKEFLKRIKKEWAEVAQW